MPFPQPVEPLKSKTPENNKSRDFEKKEIFNYAFFINSIYRYSKIRDQKINTMEKSDTIHKTNYYNVNSSINSYALCLRTAYFLEAIIPYFERSYGSTVQLINERSFQYRFFSGIPTDPFLFDYYPLRDRIFIKSENVWEHKGLSIILKTYLPSFNDDPFWRPLDDLDIRNHKYVLGMSKKSPGNVNFFRSKNNGDLNPVVFENEKDIDMWMKCRSSFTPDTRKEEMSELYDFVKGKHVLDIIL